MREKCRWHTRQLTYFACALHFDHTNIKSADRELRYCIYCTIILQYLEPILRILLRTGLYFFILSIVIHIRIIPEIIKKKCNNMLQPVFDQVDMLFGVMYLGQVSSLVYYTYTCVTSRIPE